MLYSILIYASEDGFDALSEQQRTGVLDRHAELRRDLLARGQLGPTLRLAPRLATTVRRAAGKPVITDGPFAESKEQLMGIYVLDCATIEEAQAAVQRLAFENAVFEIRPLVSFDPGVLAADVAADKK